MQTPSEELRRANCGEPSQRRSVFQNYKTGALDESYGTIGLAGSEGARRTGDGELHLESLQQQIDIAVARSFLHRFVAKLFEYPATDGWDWLTRHDTERAVRTAATAIGIEKAAEALMEDLSKSSFSVFLDAHLAAFGHAARGPVPMNEIEYGDLKADPLFQPHRLADLAAFYRAFGLEIAPDATERQDHICLQLEFMSVLAAKEAFALEHQMDSNALAACRAAQKDFLREHLARWAPAFTRRLERSSDGGLLPAMACFTHALVVADCERYGVRPGSEDLVLRPVDDQSDLLCASCGIHNLPPGALTAT